MHRCTEMYIGVRKYARSERTLTANYICEHPVESAEVFEMNTQQKKQEGVTPKEASPSGRYAQPTTAPSQMPVHQVRVYNVRMIMSASITARRETKVDLNSQTTSQLVRVIAHKHALGYKLNSIHYSVVTGTWFVRLTKRTVTSVVGSKRMGVATLVYDESAQGYIQTSPDREYVRCTVEGRQ